MGSRIEVARTTRGGRQLPNKREIEPRMRQISRINSREGCAAFRAAFEHRFGITPFPSALSASSAVKILGCGRSPRSATIHRNLRTPRKCSPPMPRSQLACDASWFLDKNEIEPRMAWVGADKFKRGRCCHVCGVRTSPGKTPFPSAISASSAVKNLGCGRSSRWVYQRSPAVPSATG